jgi:hypothetical protein
VEQKDMMSLLMLAVGIVAGATMYGDELLIPIGIVALVSTVLLIITPAATLAEALLVLLAITTWYAGAIYLVYRAIGSFKQK